MKGGTLFSGIGAPELAAPEIDWRWCAETDPFASAVLAARFPHSRNLGDVEKVDWDAVEPVDIVVFGSPCQSFSVAGQRAGLDDPRGNLALVGLRVARQLRVRWLVFENVPGILSSDEGRDFGAFLGLLGECGYHAAWRILDAQFVGVPQRRRRVFVVGCLGDWRGAAAVLFERESLRWNPAPCREAGEGVAASALRCSKGGGTNTQFRGDGADTLVAYGGNNTAGPIEVATACNAHGGPHGRLDFETETFVTQHAVAFRTNQTSALGPIHSIDVTDTLAQDHPPAIAFHARQDPDSGPVTHPLDTDGSSIGVASFRWKMGAKAHGIGYASEQAGSVETNDVLATHDAMSVRRLTPVECERLQGFPDGFTAIAYRGKPAADGNRYRSLGNAMATPVIGWILRRAVVVDAIGNDVESGTLLAIK